MQDDASQVSVHEKRLERATHPIEGRAVADAREVARGAELVRNERPLLALDPSQAVWEEPALAERLLEVSR